MAKIRIRGDDPAIPDGALGTFTLRDGRKGFITETTVNQSGYGFTKMSFEGIAPDMPSAPAVNEVTSRATGPRKNSPFRVSAIDANFGVLEREAEKAKKAAARNLTALREATITMQSFGMTRPKKISSSELFRQESLCEPWKDEDEDQPRKIGQPFNVLPKSLGDPVAFKRATFELEERICDLRIARSTALQTGRYSQSRMGFWADDKSFPQLPAGTTKVFVSDGDLADMERDLAERKKQASLPF